MSSACLDLDAYLERVNWSNPVRTDHATLAGLLRAHMENIPFENLDVLLGRRIRLDIGALQDKLVHGRRGGYCFEHVSLFAAVLESLGFAPVRHLARVVMLVPRSQAPRTHMFLTVVLPEGRFVLDPGFGGLSPRVPVPLVDGAQIRLEHEAHAMGRVGNEWILRAQVGGNPLVDAWMSNLEAENLVDFDLGNHYTATHPNSAFVNRLMLRAFTTEGRVTVMNRDLTLWCGNASQSITIEDRTALRGLLVEYFGFDLPEVQALRVPMIPEWQ